MLVHCTIMCLVSENARQEKGTMMIISEYCKLSYYEMCNSF